MISVALIRDEEEERAELVWRLSLGFFSAAAADPLDYRIDL